MATSKDAETAPSTAELAFPSRLTEAEAIVRKNVYWSMGASLLPVPLWDLVGIAGVQLKMLNELSKLYGVKFSENLAKNLVAALLGSVGATGIGTGLVSSLVKLVPGMGAVSNLVGLGVVAGAATYAIGRVFTQHFESGGTFLDFDPVKTRAYFAEQFKEGHKTAADMKHAARQGA